MSRNRGKSGGINVDIYFLVSYFRDTAPFFPASLNATQACIKLQRFFKTGRINDEVIYMGKFDGFSPFLECLTSDHQDSGRPYIAGGIFFMRNPRKGAYVSWRQGHEVT